MIVLPIFGAFLEAAGTILEKKILKNKFIDFRNYTVYEFLAIVLMVLPFVLFFPAIKSEAYTPYNLTIFAFVIVISVLANLFIFYSLKRETIGNFEPIWLMQPLFIVILAFIFYQSERNWYYVLLALVASISLIVAHVKKNHLVFDKYILAAVFGSFLFSVELVATKQIVDLYSPFMLYFIRCFFVLLICYALFRPGFKPAFKNKKTLLMIIVVGLFWVVYRAIIYYGYSQIGVIHTTILFILSPVFMLIFAVIYLKEKLTARQIISNIIILICVVLTLFV